MSAIKVEKLKHGTIEVAASGQGQLYLTPDQARELYTRLGDVLGVECEHLYDAGEDVCRCGEMNRSKPEMTDQERAEWRRKMQAAGLPRGRPRGYVKRRMEGP